MRSLFLLFLNALTPYLIHGNIDTTVIHPIDTLYNDHDNIEDHIEKENYELETTYDDSSNRISILIDDGLHGSWFAQSPTPDVIMQRNHDQYPFVSMEYYISKANTIIDRLNIPNISNVLRYQYDTYHMKPIIFMPSEYILYYLNDLLELNVTYTLITVSNQPVCVPYMSYPAFCYDNPDTSQKCNNINKIFDHIYLDKWFTKNPCIKHSKLYPIPIGPKWQISSRHFYDENGLITSFNHIYRHYGLKPYALFNNFSHLLHDTTHNNLQDVQFNNDPSISVRDAINAIDESLITNKDQFFGFVKKQRDFNPAAWFLQVQTAVFPGKDQLLYFNFFANNTDKPLYRPHANTRRLAYDSLIGQGFQPSPVRQISGYLQDLSEHKFCISPPGVGLDAHRTWEALMVGTIPIVLSSPLDELFKDLPVVIVNSYAAITHDALHDLYAQAVAQSATYNFEKLFVHYWDRVIN